MSPEYVRKICLLLLLSVGAIVSPWASAENALRGILIQSLLDFNAILITEVDVVFVYDEATAGRMPPTKGEWYAQKYDLLREDPQEVDVITTSIPQGFDSATVSLPENSAAAVKVFAVGYHEAQDVAVHELTEIESALIQIDQFGIRVSDRN